jgi:outer membrane protein assembly factor BamB
MRGLLLFLLCACSASFAIADDWPQWMGPERDNVWRESGIVEQFPEGGPRVVWRAPVAGGYAGPAVANGKVYVADYVTEENVKVDNFQRQEFTGIERVLCLDAATGRELWKHEYPVKYTISYPAGPRCTPTVHDGKVYALGAMGNLFCFDAASGGILWSKDFIKDYNTKAALWGYCGHPLVDGQKLLCVVGGEGSHAVAFDKDTGKEIWRNLTSPEQGYSPPTIIEAGGTRQLILLRPNAVTSVDPETGREYWSVPYEATGNSIIMSPIQWQDDLYVGGYDKRNMLLQLSTTAPAAEILWRDQPQHAVSPINVQPFLEGDVIYGFDQDGRLYAVEMPGGNRLWNTTEPVSQRPVGSGTAFIVKEAEQDRFWLFTENGDLVIARLTPGGYEELDRAHILEPTNNAFGREVVWCAPAYAGGRVFVRNDAECVCVELSGE